MDFCKEKEVLERQKMRGLELFDFGPLFLLVTIFPEHFFLLTISKLKLKS
jgi:hypothetical protein